MRFLLSFLLIWSLSYLALAQDYIDKKYQISTTMDVAYGKSVDFAGDTTLLGLDISVPSNDTPAVCGRPLFVFIHGGAFLVGDKSDASPSLFREEFAKRGYVAASVGYRLGMFHTEKKIHCNISGLGLDWDCLNMADSSEWYRAYFRAVQDVNGAIRYLVDSASKYGIDPNNIFVAGESAGGFIAMGVGFLSDDSEVLKTLTGAMSNVQSPNGIYEAPCIQKYGLDTSIQTMTLSRPALGSYKGELNPTTHPYYIRGVGNFFGAVFNDIFNTHTTDTQALYLYHQPNDLIVPFATNRVFAGLNSCAASFPFNCQNIINRPMVMGSKAIKDMIDAGSSPIVYDFDVTTNNANCGQQLATPSLSGHRTDNFGLRSGNMAKFFANYVADCSTNSVRNLAGKPPIRGLYPNPVDGKAFVITGDVGSIRHVEVRNMEGRLVGTTMIVTAQGLKIKMNDNVVSGVYTCTVSGDQFVSVHKLIVE